MKQFLSTIFIILTCGAYAQIPLNWTRDEINPGEDFTVMPDESLFTQGLKSCHLQLNSGSVPYLKSDVFFITPGAEYEFSFDVLDNDTAGQVKIYADFYDVYGFDVFGQVPVFSVDSSEWQTVNWTGTIPMQAAVGYVLIKFYNQPDPYQFTRTAHIWLDNFVFSENGGNNLILNGSFEEWIVGVEEAGRDQEFLTVYPNPARDFVNIRIAGRYDFITLSDVGGREVLKINSHGQEIIQADISHLQKGLYFVRCFLSGKSISANKLLIY